MGGYVNAVMVDIVGCINNIYFYLSSFRCFLKAFQSVYQFPHILCYNVLCDFISLIFPLKSSNHNRSCPENCKGSSAYLPTSSDSQDTPLHSCQNSQYCQRLQAGPHSFILPAQYPKARYNHPYKTLPVQDGIYLRLSDFEFPQQPIPCFPTMRNIQPTPSPLHLPALILFP